MKFKIQIEKDKYKWYKQAYKNKTFTIFSDPDFLDNFEEEKIYGYILKGNEKKAFFNITLKNEKLFRPGAVIHNGIILNDNVFSQKQVRKNLDMYYINEAFVEYLEKNFGSIDLALHPYIIDIRPYLWLNYHSPNEEDKCKVYVRYTSYLNIENLENLFDGLLEIRKRNIKEAKNKKVLTKIENKVELFCKFYKETIESQGYKVEDKALETLSKIISSLIQREKAKMFVSYYKNKPIYITVWAWDFNRAYYMYGAGDISINLRFKGTINFWDSIEWLSKEKKIREIDWEGINSPKRGFFKQSFGGNLLNYYWIKKGV